MTNLFISYDNNHLTIVQNMLSLWIYRGQAILAKSIFCVFMYLYYVKSQNPTFTKICVVSIFISIFIVIVFYKRRSWRRDEFYLKKDGNKFTINKKTVIENLKLSDIQTTDMITTYSGVSYFDIRIKTPKHKIYIVNGVDRKEKDVILNALSTILNG